MNSVRNKVRMATFRKAWNQVYSRSFDSTKQQVNKHVFVEIDRSVWGRTRNAVYTQAQEEKNKGRINGIAND